MIVCKSLNKEFETRDEMFRELKHNENKIISLKKARLYKSALKGQISINGAYLRDDSVTKAGLQVKSGYVYPVINTTRYMDMHDDVHWDGLWKKTLKENVGKIFYLSGHIFNLDNVIAWPEDVNAFTKIVPWISVGKDFEGDTEALIFEIAEEKLVKESARDAIRERRKVQGSVSMQYVKVMMGIDSNDKEYILNKQYYDSKIDLIANKKEVKDQGYFFGVEEGKIAREGSLVLLGSNDATEIIYPDNEEVDDVMEDDDKNCRKPKKEFQPEQSTEKNIEPPSGTQIDWSKLKIEIH